MNKKQLERGMVLCNVVENEKAITSWSGFVYQGMIALLTAIRELNDNANIDENCILQIEKVDDFSIHDGNNDVISIHQVKCKKASASGLYNDAIISLTQKKNQLVNVDAYLHTSVPIRGFSNNNVDLYTYENDLNHMPILRVEENLYVEIGKYIDNNLVDATASDSDIKMIAINLNILIRDLVRTAHADNMTGNVSLVNINREIPFGVIINEIESFNFGQQIDEESCIKHFKAHLALKARLFIEEEELEVGEEENVSDVVDKFTCLSNDNFVKFLKILMPVSTSERIRSLQPR